MQSSIIAKSIPRKGGKEKKEVSKVCRHKEETNRHGVKTYAVFCILIFVPSTSSTAAAAAPPTLSISGPNTSAPSGRMNSATTFGCRRA